MAVALPYSLGGDRRTVVAAGTTADPQVRSLLAACGDLYDPSLLDPSAVVPAWAAVDVASVADTDASPTDPRSIRELLADLAAFTEQQNALAAVESPRWIAAHP